MAPITRSSIRRIIKSKTDLKLANDSTDILINLDYMLFVRDLMFEAEKLADKSGSSEILSTHLRMARVNVLKKYRG
ncbi:hypothetical protein WICANDRAFT_61912 [Wickerhamomyces anomalus NRRL Y-366-8]|uniref:Transcription factor CBF/NF-Y/archaeal histone domain-containing protein n=1 Tax=Wickerhamomyces anomalus (strain ATCC 58044 / CBS 1984 / NCYC 433 / NRRL Y-366-8) TaxID=683960 RepID=A0A1E3P7F4_WICAA|nr:uncharacterized protein WICANDRAFT_61912 [Wickerhamomyces anomalus NRRL Y-366-8]ODQ61356.1 hypothetical protein WICANDRAFT_61912 [Wickerhamomyces anomalus NRRL Y-366-8]